MSQLITRGADLDGAVLDGADLDGDGVPVALPFDPLLQGFDLDAQAIVVDPGGRCGYAASGGLAFQIG